MLEPAGINGGAQAGYNRQTGRFVDGFEADIQLSSADDTFAAYQYSNLWFGTARGRAGIALSNVLLYATAGLAYGGEKFNFVGTMQTHTDVGWTAGGAIEVGLTRNWSAEAEYLYFDLGGQNYVLTSVNTGLSSGRIRLGANYRL